MTKKDKINFIINYLEKIYPKTPIPLDHSNEFELLIAVLLSAQCTDKGLIWLPLNFLHMLITQNK